MGIRDFNETPERTEGSLRICFRVSPRFTTMDLLHEGLYMMVGETLCLVLLITAKGKMCRPTTQWGSNVRFYTYDPYENWKDNLEIQNISLDEIREMVCKNLFSIVKPWNVSWFRSCRTNLLLEQSCIHDMSLDIWALSSPLPSALRLPAEKPNTEHTFSN